MSRHIWLVILFLVIEIIYYINGEEQEQCKLPLPVEECIKENGKVIYIKAILREENLQNNDGEISNEVRDKINNIKAKDDDAAHLIAANLGGTGKYIENIVPFNSHLNRGKMRVMEQEVYKLVQELKEPITYEVWVNYDSSDRPTSIKYKATKPDITKRNGKLLLLEREFKNTIRKSPPKKNPEKPNPKSTICELPAPVVECKKKNGKVIYIKAILREENLQNNEGEISKEVIDKINKIKYKREDAAHLIAANLGGTGKYIENIVPFDSHLNRGEMRVMEQKVYKLVKESKEPITYEVWVQWNKDYSPDHPVSITYKVTKYKGDAVSPNDQDPILKKTFVDPLYNGPVERNPDKQNPDVIIPNPDQKDQESLNPDNPSSGNPDTKDDHHKPDKQPKPDKPDKGGSKKRERENPNEHSRYCHRKRRTG